jgi:hypothetical protein
MRQNMKNLSMAFNKKMAEVSLTAPTLITEPETFYIQIISGIFPAKPISCHFGKRYSILTGRKRRVM